MDKKIPKLLESLFVSSKEDNMKVKVLNSQQKSNLFHFKVMELKVHEDTNNHSVVREKFNFFFEMLKTKDEKKNPLECFEWDVNSNPIQRLYLSRDTKLMMEVINNFAATVYKKQWI